MVGVDSGFAPLLLASKVAARALHGPVFIIKQPRF